MIQRIQTVWLLLAALCGIALFYFNLFSVYPAGQATGLPVRLLDGTTYLFILSAMALATIALPAVAVFLFKNRKKQMSYIWLSLTFVLLFIVMAVWHASNYPGTEAGVKTTFGIGCFLPLVAAFFHMMALRGIRRDEKLVRSMDRLR